MAASYWVRFKEQVKPEDRQTWVTVLSRASQKLTEGPAAGEYTVVLRREGPDRIERFELTMRTWAGKGLTEWRRL